jgi:hypothetical protein
MALRALAVRQVEAIRAARFTSFFPLTSALSLVYVSVAQSCTLSISLGIVAGRDDFLPSTSNTQHPTPIGAQPGALDAGRSMLVVGCFGCGFAALGRIADL